MEESSFKDNILIKKVVAISKNKDLFIDFKNELSNFINNPSHDPSTVIKQLEMFQQFLVGKYFMVTAEKIAQLHSYIDMIVELHEVDSLGDKIDNEFKESGLIDIFNDELSEVLHVLGYDFLYEGNTVVVEKTVLDDIENNLTNLIDKIDSPLQDNLLNIINSIKRIKLESFYQLVESYINESMYIARKFNKKIYPIKFHCPKDIMVPSTFKELTKSLIHVFVNALDHGIETSNIRVDKGKDEYGTIECNIIMSSNILMIEISDDGQGIDVDDFSTFLVSKNLKTQDEIDSLFEDEILALIFEDGITTKEHTSNIERHGTGMGRIKKFVDELNGSINIDSIYGKGTKITIAVPVNYEEKIATNDNLNVMNSVLVQCASFLENTAGIEFYTNKESDQFIVRDENCYLTFGGDFEGQIAFSFDRAIIDYIGDIVFEGFEGDELVTLKNDLINEIVNTILGLAIQNFPSSKVNTVTSIPYSFDNESIQKDIEVAGNTIIRNMVTSVGKISCILIER